MADDVTDLVAPERIEDAIHTLRGHRVLLDADLAELYDAETRALVQAVKRNVQRFPADFMFQLTAAEDAARLRSQSVISKPGRGGRRSLPYAFTEQGVAMLSSVLRSERAIAVNIAIMRAFVRMRRLAELHDELAQRLDDLERRTDGQDEKIATILAALRQLMNPPAPGRRRIGFDPDDTN